MLHIQKLLLLKSDNMVIRYISMIIYDHRISYTYTPIHCVRAIAWDIIDHGIMYTYVPKNYIKMS